MTLIDKYIYTVTKHLPETSVTEVEKELRSNILDMLPEDYTDNDIEKVLYQLGNPVDLAGKYREGKRYLIGPSLYGNYCFVLKLVYIIVASCVPIAAFVIAATDSSLKSPGEVLLHVLIQTIVIAIEAAFQVFAWVTVIFVILERSGAAHKIKWPYTGKDWTVSDLLEPQQPRTNQISKADSVILIFFTVVFTGIICFFPELFAWYSKSNGLWVIEPLFNVDILANYIPFILLTSAIGISSAVLMLVFGKWNVTLAAVKTVHNFCIAALAGSILFNSRIFSNAFKITFMKTVDLSQDVFAKIWRWSIWGIMIFILTFCIWDTVSSFRNIHKN